MIHPIKIVIKGYPAPRDIDHDFYNENDLMSPIRIVVNDFPTFISVSFNLETMKFYNHSNAKLKINVKPESAIYVKFPEFDAFASTKMKLKSDFTVKTGFDNYADSKMKLLGHTNEKFGHEARIVKTTLNQKGTISEKIKISGIKILSDKCYLVRNDKLLGYWDDYTLEEMDEITNLELGGTIVG